jgi:hypothetical protein
VLSGPSKETISLNYTTSNLLATTGNKDYTLATGTLTFAPGETSKTITVMVLGDDTYEVDEDFTLTLTPLNPSQLDGSPASISKTVFIINDDAVPEFSITDAAVTETESSQTVKLTIKLTNPSYQTVSIAYQTSDEIDAVSGLKTSRSATAINDYTLIAPTAVSFLPGDVLKEIYITVKGDSIDEYDEAFFVNLFNPTNARIKDAQGSITIRDNDAAPTVTIVPVSPKGAVAPLNYVTVAAETDTATVPVQFNVILTGATEKEVVIRWDATRGTAISNSWDEINEPIDFANNADSSDLNSDADEDTTLTFTAPGTKTITVYVQPDDKDEGLEFFYVNLLNSENAEITNNHVTVEIQDDDTGPTGQGHIYDVRFSRPTYTVVEGDADAITYVTLTRTQSSGMAYTVLSITGGSASFGSDYTTSSPITRMLVVFAAGESVKQIPVTIIGDNIHETDETITFGLRKPTGEPVKGFPGTATLTIVDDDRIGVTVETDESPNFVTEGGSYSFKIRLVDLDDPAHPNMATGGEYHRQLQHPAVDRYGGGGLHGGEYELHFCERRGH